MKKKLFGSLLLLSIPFLVWSANVKIGGLTVEYTETPMGIDVLRPRFTWQMLAIGDAKNCYQAAYQITVKDEAFHTVWTSGKIKSDTSLNLEYGGKNLLPTTRYNWTVEVWDQQNVKHTASSWFETGLMNDDPSLPAWSGAKWIGGKDEDMVFYSPYLPVFKINYTLQLDVQTNTTKAGFIYGANDSRLMDKNKNLYKLENKRDESYLLLELDISPLAASEKAALNIYRVGYHPDDQKNKPFKSFPVPISIINNGNKYAKHSFSLATEMGNSSIHIDGDGKENLVAELNLNPLGAGGDFIAFPMVADIGFDIPAGQSASFSNVEVRHFRNPSNLIFSENLEGNSYTGIFSKFTSNLSVSAKNYQVNGGNTGAFLIANPSRNSTPMLRSTFAAASSTITKARLYVTARGIYEMYINGKRVGNDYFNPGLTQYNKTHLYQTFDVTNYMLPGKNAIGAVLGEGWWSGGSTYMGQFWNFFGDRQSLLAKLVVTYANGQQDVIVTDPSKWSYYGDGPLKYGSFFQGEVYDATKEPLVSGWNTPAYNDSVWRPATEVSLMEHISHDSGNLRFNMAVVDDYSHASLTGQFGQTAKKIKELTALSVQQVKPGVFVYDMGQNMVGVPHITISGFAPGKKITLRFAEVKYPALPEYKDNAGMVMLENIRAAMAQDIYICKGGTEIIAPRFTYHGYRFIEISGIDKPLPLASVRGTVISSVFKLSSSYNTSNAKVNKLWENITWSTFANFLSIPTDCPQRNERLGWSGDISVYSRTATYLATVPQFLRRHMLAMRDVQRADGRFTDVAPLGGGFGGLLWGSAAITVAWESYQQYNDKQLLTEHYDGMKQYIKYLREKNINKETNILEQENPHFWGNLGDWLGPEQGKNDNSLLWESYFLYDLEIMMKSAAVLGKKDDEKEFTELFLKRKKFFNDTYVDKQTKKTIHSGFNQFNSPSVKAGNLIDIQTSYVLPLAFNVYEPENKTKAVKNFVETITRQNKAENGVACPPYSLMTGFIGTAWISKALSDNGRNDIAYKLLQQTSFPSWLYSVEQGATTIWERLDSYTHTAGFGGNNRMNSFNHYSFGAVGAWMYNYSLGIQRDEQSPGFKHFLLQPEPDPTGEMRFAQGHYESMYGRIESSWAKKGNGYTYRFVVPANTKATVCLRLMGNNGIKNVKPPTDAKFIAIKNGKVFYGLASGTYIFSVYPN